MTADELTVLSWGGQWGRALRAAVSDPFERRTGIRVRHDRHVGLDLPDGLLTALRTGSRPPVDVVWSNAVAALRAADEGLCEPLSPAEVPSLMTLHPRAHPPGYAGWPVVMAYSVLYVLVYRRGAFRGGAPDSWGVLLDPRHRSKVVLYPHGHGIHAVAQLLGGGALADIPADMSACWRFLARLAPQVRALYYSVGLGESLRRGDLDLCFRALPNALGFLAEGADVDWVVPREGSPDTMDTLWVPRFLPPTTSDRARRYLDFALSAPVQQRWCGMLGTIPVHPDSRAPEVLRRRPGTPSTLDVTDVLYVPDVLKAAHDQEWRSRFDAIFAEHRHAEPPCPVKIEEPGVGCQPATARA